MIESVSRVAALLLLVVVAVLAAGRVVLGERHAGDPGGVVDATRPPRLRRLDGWLAGALALLVIALGAHLAAGIQ